MQFEQSGSFSAPIAQEQTFIQRVYQWMALGLALTGFVALWVARSPAALEFVYGGGFWILFLVQIGLVIWLSARVMTISPAAASIGFLVYSALNGMTLAGIFIVYTRASIASTFFISSGTFAAASLYGWSTKRDLTSLGSFFMMALLGLIIASVVNLFFRAPLLYWIITYFGVFLFIGLTVYDTQRLKLIHQSAGGSISQMAILGALKLYLDFINLFLLLLRVFGRRK